VPVGARAFEIVEILAQSAGELVTKDELMNRVWPGAIVNDNTLQMHISAVRKALGPHRSMLKTESGRGYRLLGTWTFRRQEPVPSPLVLQPPRESSRPPTNLPVLATGLVGRSSSVGRLRDLVSAYRTVTLTGPGGIGKTTLALEVAGRLVSEFNDGVWFVELGSLTEPGLVPAAVAGVLGLKLTGEEISAQTVARAGGGSNLLLILDNCEHVIDAAADLVEAFVRFCPRTTILTTSREALRTSGEFVYRVPPLEVPAANEEAPDQILGRGAVELFLARAEALGSHFSRGSENLASVASICRHLDGIPLAIEFAAARAAVLGIQHVAAGLSDRFGLLTGGRRTALPRHRTLRAALDWSYDLLTQAERRLLRHLAVFQGGFDLNAAAAVMKETGFDESAVIEGIANLVAKSLVVLDKSEVATRWNLLETIRAYGIEKLEESGEFEQTARRHAAFFLDVFQRFASAGTAGPPGVDRYRQDVDNLRAALTWAFSPMGDAAFGVELTTAAVDFWFVVSLIGECCEWAAMALARIGPAMNTRREQVLQCGLGLALMHTTGMNDDARGALTRALSLARDVDDIDYQQRATYGLWMFTLRSAEYQTSLTFGRQYEAIAQRLDDPDARMMADMMIGVSRTILGEHFGSRDRRNEAAGYSPVTARYRDIVRGIDVRTATLNYVVLNLWCRGLLDQAVDEGRRSIAEARELDHPFSLSRALLWPNCVLALKLGDLDTAERYISEGNGLADRHAMSLIKALGSCSQGILVARRGDAGSGIELLRSGLARMRETKFLYHYAFFVAELAEVLGAAGRIDDGLSEIDTALRSALETRYLWFVPEILRIKGELLILGGSGDRPAIEGLFRQSLERARRQQAHYWEICTATSLAAFMHGQGRVEEARELVAPVYERVTEGFSSSQVRRAKALLDRLT
jgi:non-specific serine/threonine protein kinase